MIKTFICLLFLTNFYWNTSLESLISELSQYYQQHQQNSPNNTPANKQEISKEESHIQPSPETTTDDPEAIMDDANNPFLKTTGLYTEKDSQAVKWVKDNPNDERAKIIKEKIASIPTARWFGGWNTDEVDNYVSEAAKEKKLPIIVAYNIPLRDCGGYSAGGANSAKEYKEWIRKIAKGIGDRSAVVILEPDALIHLDCLSDADRQTRFALLKEATEILKQNAPAAWTYIDGGDGKWKSPEDMAEWLKEAGVVNTRGVSLNVSNYNKTTDVEQYGTKLTEILKNKYNITSHLVIDTSRNGNGSNGQWCNPSGRKLGNEPSIQSSSLTDAYLWIKRPGESDGDCGIGQGTQAGQFTPELAMSLINGS
ncbi:glycoside hydrolase family 6 protein [Shimazuella sp. AN120528]|uniref:glycoside hydrolase family 6 protein n=1 Tax=Shimazuella soli TaxID=1892854 RepID=UPI001F106D6D|nr:glycoside hydrolase family 6 protein [Shimazuella soli]MCH5583825.1 glycoside hydrolase family 6 protein [Shimazuella soli]